MKSANQADYIVMCCYGLLMIGVGIYVTRFNRSAADYFRGNNRIPWFVAGLSAFMSGFSAWTFTGGAGVAYKFGIAAVGLYIGNAVSFLLGYTIFAARWRRSRISTVMEYLSGRFTESTRQIFSWATVLIQLFTNASILYGLSLFVSSACGFSEEWTILVCGAVITFYCVIGGLWGVVLTEFLQASILIPFCLVLVVRSLVRVGGIGGLWLGLPPEMKTLHVHGQFGWLYLFSWTIMVSFGYNSSAMAQRYFSVDNDRSARKVALLCCGLFFLGAFVWFIPPMAMRIVYPNLHAVWPSLANPNEAAFAVASLTLLPNGLIGIMLAAMFSSTMANLSANFNVKAAILSKDVYQGMIRKSTNDRELLLVGRVATFLVGAATTGIAITMASRGQSIFSMMLIFNTLLSLAYGPPALLGLVVRRTPPWSGLLSFSTGLVLGILGVFVFRWTLMQEVAVIVPSSFAIFLLSRLWDRGDTPGRAALFVKLDTPINVAEELKGSPDMTSVVFRFLSRVVVAVGALSLLLLFQSAPAERSTVLCFAALTCAIGVSLRFIRGQQTTLHPIAELQSR